MNNEYCILLSKLLLPLLHKPKDLIYRAGSSLPMKLNFNQFFYVSTQRQGTQPRCSRYVWHRTIKNSLCMYFLRKIRMLNYLHFIFTTCRTPSGGLSTSRPLMFVFISSVAHKQCFSCGTPQCWVLLFSPNIAFWCVPLKSNWVVKQSLKQPRCNHWLFHSAQWFRHRAIKALPSAHPLVL